MYGPPVPPPQGGRSNRRIIIAVVVAVALAAAAGGFWFFTQGGSSSDGPDTPAAKDYDAGVREVGAAEVAWQVPQGPVQELAIAEEHWVTDTHLVRRLAGKVAAFDLKTGDVAWEIPLDGPHGDRCQASQEHSGNRVVLLRSTGEAESDNTCGKLTVIDIAAGKEVVTAPLPPTKRGKVPTSAGEPVVLGEWVLIGGEAPYVLDLNTGQKVTAPSAYATCNPLNVALVGDVVVADSECPGNYDDKDTKNDLVYRLRGFDANLEPLWEWETPKADDGERLPVHGVLSVDPLVVEVGPAGSQRQLMRVDVASGQTVPISVYDAGKTRAEYMSACTGSGLGVCETATVVDNKVIVMTTPAQVNPSDPDAAPGQQSTEFRNEFVAFDLDSGEEAWRTGKVDGRSLSLVPSTGDAGVVAYQPMNPNGSKAIVFSVDPKTGELKPLMPIGPKAHENDELFDQLTAFSFGGDNQQAVWRDGLFIVFKKVHRTETAGNVDMVAFALK